MAMSHKHFEAMATTAAGMLVDIKSSDKTLANILRGEILDIIVETIKSGTLVDSDSRFDESRFRQAVWARVAQHDV